ncbi:MAG: hypothetical protein OXI96_06595 [Acidimicrobiaceae bacterium]|nr:hypothetical protein [Acidimicrobiaceae bacterium]
MPEDRGSTQTFGGSVVVVVVVVVDVVVVVVVVDVMLAGWEVVDRLSAVFCGDVLVEMNANINTKVVNNTKNPKLNQRVRVDCAAIAQLV